MIDEEFEAALAGMPVQTIEVVRLPNWENRTQHAVTKMLMPG